MPGGDGTGPLGFGPGTGRAAGYCAGYYVPGFANPLPGRRRWRSFGYRGPWYYGSAVTDEKSFLEQQAKFLREHLRLLEERLDEIDKGEKSD